LLLASFAVSSFAATAIADIESDVAAVSSQVTKIDNLIRKYVDVGASIPQGLALRSEGLQLIKMLDKATVNTNALRTPVSDSDARSLLVSLQNVEPVITGGHAFVVAHKPFTTAGVRTLFRRNLANLQASTTAFSDALLRRAPANYVAEGTAIKKKIDDAFANTFAAFK